MRERDVDGLEGELVRLRAEVDRLSAELKGQRPVPPTPPDLDFRRLVANLPLGVLCQGPGAEILVCNGKALDLLGLTEDQLLGRSSFDPTWNVIREDGSNFAGPDHPVPVAIATRRPVRNVIMGVFRPITQDRVWLLVNAEPILTDAGEVLQVLCTFSDITDRKRFEEGLLEAKKMESLGRLAGGIAHDFNNLLTIILSAVTLEEGDVVSPAIDEGLTMIRRAAERGGALTRQLLALARRQVVTVRPMNLNTVLLDVDLLLRRVLREDVELVTFPGPDLWNVQMDPGQVEQILVNLAINARDAMSGGGRLSLQTRNVSVTTEPQPLTQLPPGDYVELSVSDTGVGLSEAARQHLFEPFFTTKERGRGTGLGLAIVQGIVLQAGGQIAALPGEAGAGAVFRIWLPRTKERPQQSASRRLEVEPLGGHETILLAEDDHGVRTLAVRTLKTWGYTVIEAPNGSEGLQLAAAHQGSIDLLVTDLIMPHLGGRALAEQLGALRPGLRVLFVSGYPGEHDMDPGLTDAAAHFLPKPYTPRQLLQRVRLLLDAPALG